MSGAVPVSRCDGILLPAVAPTPYQAGGHPFALSGAHVRLLQHPASSAVLGEAPQSTSPASFVVATDTLSYSVVPWMRPQASCS
jgi:hypothetical protein